jgi:hypothetical protein
MSRIDANAARHRITQELPARIRWILPCGPLDFDFTRSQRELRPLRETDTNGFDSPKEWNKLLLFGEETYCEGGGYAPFLGVSEETGQVFGLDVDRESDSAMYLLNSDVDRYIQTFKVFDQALGHETVSHDLVEKVRKEARAIDPAVFDITEWSDLADFIDESLDALDQM